MIQLPRDGNHVPIQMTPVGLALASTYDATVSASTELTLNASTTYIEVTALLKGIFMKWGGTASSTSFDEFIAPDTTCAFVVPTGQLTVQFIEEAATAHLAVVEK